MTMARSSSAGAARRQLKIPEKHRLVEAIEAVGILSDQAKRTAVLGELRNDFGSAFDPRASGSANVDIWSIVSTCVQLGALGDLVVLLRAFGGASPEWQELNTLVEELLRPLPEGRQRARLEELVGTLTAEALTDVLADPSLAPLLPPLLEQCTDAVEGLRRLEEVSGPTGDRAQLLYLELTAHRLDEQAAIELHRLIDDLCEDLGGRAAVREVCDGLYERAAAPDAASSSPDEAALALLDATVSIAGEATSGDDVNSMTATMPESDSGRVSRPTTWGGVPPKNTHFTGRDEILETIAAGLREHDQATLVPQPVHGLGGIGKTQLAIEFAYRNQSFYDLVWWVQADDDRSIRRSFVSLAKRLDLPPSDAVEDTVDAVLDVLRLGEVHRRWLLIFDNADDPATLQPFLPTGSGHVLITSRNRSWANERNAIEVDVFRDAESVALLRGRWPELTEEQALELAERLGHLPLALEQAVAVHLQTGMQLQEYLRILDEHPTAVLAEGTPAGYRTSVAVTLRVAFERLRERSEAAAQLLELCVFLSSHPLAVPMLMRGRGADLPAPLREVIRDDAQLRMAVRELGRFALAQIDPGRDLIRIHGLIGAVLRDDMSQEERVRNEASAHAVLGLSNPGRPDDSINWPQLAQIAPHIVPSGAVFSDNTDARRAVLDQIRYYLAIGDYAASRNLGEYAVEIWHGRLGPDNEMTLIARRHLANALRAVGEYDTARQLNEDVLERMRRTLTPDHEHTLATAMNVAADLRLLGQFEQAKELDEDNFGRYRRVMGEDDLSTLRQAHNLAVDYRLLGLFRRAHDLDETTARRRGEILGEDNPRTLYSYASLVRDLHGLGEYQRALSMQRDKLRMHEARLPANHSELMFAKRNLAIMWRKTGNYRRALAQALANFGVYQTFYGRQHEHTLAAMLTLMNALRVNGDLDAAQQRGTEALDSYRETFGLDHPFTHACAADLAIVLRALDRHDEARALTDEAYAGLERLLGPNHPHTLCAGNNRSNDYAAAGEYDLALQTSERVFAASAAVRGADHPMTLTCAANVVLDLGSTGADAQANQLRHETLNRMRERLGPEHPEMINTSLGRRMEHDIEVTAT
ncbi:FxSxx-COOH system tetratricopeptide repeat protein [Dactylosporangium sp. NPDC005555]|uniref:FxSxx-COOH system tetratricopeptide repeat protein n=1 Tax=Dactylosporangium sp. NPDC005555 TaxID=3154889 RepID=UPI0033BAAFA5